MQKFFDFFRKHKIVCCLVVVLVLILLAFIIDLFYILGDKYLPFYFPTRYEPRDWLSFYGSTLSLGGTVALGLLALYQNEKLAEINENMFLDQQRNIKRPNFIISKILVPSKDAKTKIYKCNDFWEFNCLRTSDNYVILYLQNIGDGKAQWISINGQTSFEALFGDLSDTETEGTIEFNVAIGHDYVDKPRTIELVYENSNGCIFCQSITYLIKEEENKYRVRINRASRQYFKPKLADKEMHNGL